MKEVFQVTFESDEDELEEFLEKFCFVSIHEEEIDEL